MTGRRARAVRRLSAGARSVVELEARRLVARARPHTVGPLVQSAREWHPIPVQTNRSTGYEIQRSPEQQRERVLAVLAAKGRPPRIWHRFRTGPFEDPSMCLRCGHHYLRHISGPALDARLRLVRRRARRAARA